MKNVLIISFDLIRQDEVKQSLPIASLLAYLKKDKRYGNAFMVHHLPINMFELSVPTSINILDRSIEAFNLEAFDTVAISCYVWSEHLINRLIKMLRDCGFKGKVVLGGYQISYPLKIILKFRYPDCDIFIFGHAEESLLQAIFIDKPKTAPVFMNSEADLNSIPSPYLSGEIFVAKGQKMVRLETKRGCPYSCSFCAHRNINQNKVYMFPKEKVFKELAFLKERQVKKINLIDPTFNYGENYLEVLQEMVKLKLNSVISFQTRFELIKGNRGKAFLDLSGQLNSHFEFGVQSLMESEYKAVNRRNNKDLIKYVMKQLNERKMSYEISLIYGLPNQTVESFKQSIEFLYSNGCKNLTAYPLMLLRGTDLFFEKDNWAFKEKRMDKYRIPLVIESNSFNKNDWLKMQEMAAGLNNNNSRRFFN